MAHGKIAVMGGEQAAKTLLQIQVAGMKAKGSEVSLAEEQKLLNEIQDRYEKQTSPYYAAARLWVDAIIDPLETRQLISQGINAANHNPVMAEFKQAFSRYKPHTYHLITPLHEDKHLPG